MLSFQTGVCCGCVTPENFEHIEAKWCSLLHSRGKESTQSIMINHKCMWPKFETNSKFLSFFHYKVVQLLDCFCREISKILNHIHREMITILWLHSFFGPFSQWNFDNFMMNNLQNFDHFRMKRIQNCQCEMALILLIISRWKKAPKSDYFLINNYY